MTLSMPILGARPYVLIEFEDDPTSETGLKASVDAGGGITSADDVHKALTLVLASLPAPIETSEESE